MRIDHLSALAAYAPATVAAAGGVIPMGITHTRGSNPLRRRTDTYTQTITNNISYGGYYASISVGTPAQSQDVVLDTGSSDTWFLSSDSSACAESTSSGYGGGFRRRKRQSSACVSTFDYSSSSTFTNLSTVFEIEYVDGSAVEGYYFTDNIVVGGATIDTLEMGLAETSNDLTYGIMGVGFDADESAQTLYPNIIDKFYTSGLIGSRAYSLYLDDLASSSGTILFGGIDTDKYTGDLIAVPIIKDSAADNYTSFLVTLSSVAAVKSDGTVSANYTTDAEAVVLDSGTTLTYLPETMAESIFDTFNATYDDQEGYATVDCSLADDDSLALEFQFGGTGGPSIKIALSELVLSDGSGMGFDEGSAGSGSTTSTCAFGVSMSTDTYLLGDTFLRSAYVVYDLDAKQVALAQSNFNSTSTSIVAMTSGSSIPEVSSTATAVVASSSSSDTAGDEKHKSGAVSTAVAPWLSVGVGAIVGALLIVT